MIGIIDLVYNLSILVALSSISGFIGRRWERTTTTGKILQGLLFGVVAILGIMFPFELEKGLIFDGRTIVISLCTLFFGATAGAISAALAGIYRLWIGGVGLPMGLSTIIVAFVVGLVFHRIKSKFPIEWLTNLRLYLFGLVVHIFMMILVVTLPSKYIISVYQAVGLTVIGIYPLVTLIIGKILFDQEIAAHTLSELSKRESLFRTTLYSIGDAVITTDEKGNIRNMNQIAENLTGYKENEVRGTELQNIFKIVNEFTLESVENPVQKVLREGVVVGLANHSLLISRDGRKIPIADSGAPIRDEDGKIIGVVLVFRDQTNEREIQRKIEESELRYRQFVYFSPDGIWRFDFDIPISIDLPADEQIQKMFDYAFLAECNDVFAKMYGFESPKEIIGARLPEFLEINNPENWEYLRAFIKNNYRLSNGISTEHDKFGNIKYFENNLVGIVEDGFLIRAWGTQKDITEKKQLELTLRQSEEKFRLLAESSLTGIYLIQDFKFAYVNEALAKTFGYEVDEIIDKLGPLDLTHPDDRPRVIENVNKRVAGEIESIRYDFKGLKKDGSVVYVEVHGRRIEYAGKVGVIGTLVDITSQKKAEEGWIKLSEAVRYSPVGIIITNRDGIIEYANPKFTEITGYSQEEVVGYTPRILKFGHYTDDFYKTLWNTILSGNVWSGEMLNRKKNGELYWENLTISPIKDNKGEITHFVAIKEDITEKREMIQQLVEARLKAEESDRLKSAFLANISHEVRTPLNAMLGFAQILYLQPVTKDEVVSFAKIIYKRGQDLLRLFNDIIEISFIDTHQLIVSPKVDKVLPLINDVYATFATSEEFLGKDVELRIGKTVDEDLEFSTDFFRVKQVLYNLIHNALKFTQKGFVEFGCSLQEDGNLLFYVKDTGIGIPESKKDYVFGRFQQLDTDFLTRPYQGLGLGLAITREIVNLLGGKIWFESTVGKGTSFYFTLPPLKFTTTGENAQTQKIREPKEMTPRLDSESKLVFLVAEDEYTNFVALQKFLERTFNCEILYAKDGSEAVEIAKERKDIDLIIMDIRMPEKDGYTAFKEIREYNMSVPIIALTAYAFPDDKKRILETGFEEYIAKPFEYDDVERKIKKLLSEKKN